MKGVNSAGIGKKIIDKIQFNQGTYKLAIRNLKTIRLYHYLFKRSSEVGTLELSLDWLPSKMILEELLGAPRSPQRVRPTSAMERRKRNCPTEEVKKKK